jgi:hypothetical protein
MRGEYGVNRTRSELFEIEPNAHGAWRRHQMWRECIRVALWTGEALEDNGRRNIPRPIMRSDGSRCDPSGLRSLALYHGMEL